jgi:hypothetical protein
MTILIRHRGIKVASSLNVYLKPHELDSILAQVLTNEY